MALGRSELLGEVAGPPGAHDAPGPSGPVTAPQPGGFVSLRVTEECPCHAYFCKETVECWHRSMHQQHTGTRAPPLERCPGKASSDGSALTHHCNAGS
eukprot:1046345-Alexandrium_andersonii.AAC.1